MIRGRIVVGFMDTKLSEKLQFDPEFTLPKAINQAQQREAVKKQKTLMWNDFKESTGKKNEVDAIKTDKLPNLWPPSWNRCNCCGKSAGHIRQNCPANAAIWHKCKKRGHWALVCKSLQTIGKIEEDCASLGTIGTERKKDIWSIDLTLHNYSPCSIQQDPVWRGPHNSSHSWLLYGNHQRRRRIFISENVCGDWSLVSSPWPSSYSGAKNCLKGQCSGSRGS